MGENVKMQIASQHLKFAVCSVLRMEKSQKTKVFSEER